MSKAVKRIGPVAIAAMSALAMIGCDDTHSVDKTVRQSIEQSRLLRLEGGEDKLQKAQELLAKAASESSASPATRAHAKALLAAAEMESGRQLINQAQTFDEQGQVKQPAGVDQSNREVARLLWEIGQLGNQIDASNTLVAAYRQFEPKELREGVKQQVADANGGPDKAVWIANEKAAVPTLSAAKQEIARLEGEVNKLQEQIKGLQAQQATAATEAEKLARESDVKPGRAGLEQFKQASGLRKQAADLGNQIEVLQLKDLARAQQDLALAQARSQSVATAVEQFQKLGQQAEDGWTAVGKQANDQANQTTQILQGVGSNEEKAMSGSIAEKSSRLARHVEQSKQVYEAAEKNLTDAIQHYEEAGAAATALASEYGSAITELPSGSEMKAALQTMVSAFNPGEYKLGQANAMQALAHLHASRAQTLYEWQQLTAKLRDQTLKTSGLTLPAELGDAAIGESLKTATAAADDQYTKAADKYLDVDGAPGASEVAKNAAKTGRILALYGRSLLARSTGDANAATAHLAAAKEARDQVAAEKGAIAILPAELATPAAAPTTAPAPK